MQSTKLSKAEFRYYFKVLPLKLAEVITYKNHSVKFDCNLN